MAEPNFLPPTADAQEGSSSGIGSSRLGNISFRSVAWPLLLSLLVLLVIGYFTFDPQTFRQTMAAMNPWYMLAALATVVLRVVFGAWRFSYIARGRLSFRQGLRGQLAWDFFSNVTPSAFGGGPFAALYVSKDSTMRVGETSALVLFTMLLDQLWTALVIPFIFLATLYVAVVPPSLGSIGTLAFTSYFIGMLVWVVLFGYATLVRPEVWEWISDRVFRIKFLRRFRDRVAREMNQMSDCAKILRAQPPSFFLSSCLLTAGTWLSRYLLPVFIVLSLFPDLDSFLFFIRSITMMLCSLILPTPGGAGGVEGLYALFVGPLMPTAIVAPSLFIWRLLAYYVFVALGAFLIRVKPAPPAAPAPSAPARPSTGNTALHPREAEFVDSTD